LKRASIERDVRENGTMPDVSATERGKRYFQVMKERQAEKAISKIQKNLKTEWQLFSHTDMKILKYLFGESWVYLEQKAWDSYPFHELSRHEVGELIEIGAALQKKEISGRTAASRMEEILKRSANQNLPE
jgi:hypothetical protein